MNNKKSSSQSQKSKIKKDRTTGQQLSEKGERIQKVLARGGIGSRREVERWVEEGRLQVNGEKATPGIHLKSGDQVSINGRSVNWEKYTMQPTRVIVYNKPTGEVVTRRDPQGRPVVFSRLPKLDIGRWIAVGRLDINTSGLLLLTNNGELANRLMHPSRELDREYAVRILGEVPDEMIELLKKGVELEDGKAHFHDIQFFSGEGANKWFHVVVKEGRNRLVRRLWESQGVTVSRLMRVRYGPAVLPGNVRAHKYYELNSKELALLMNIVDLEEEKSLKPALMKKRR
ncbi:MAG: pseudouridine synthase [Methylococcales bacterium]|nr:pseudouridine synthase [Methylococcales bacterium]